MIQTSAAFQAAVVDSPRRIELLAVVDLSDPDMVWGPVITSPLAPWSQAEELRDKEFDVPARYATLERGRWLLDGSFDLYPDNYQVPKPHGVCSAALSGPDGTFSSPFTAMLQFSNVRVLQMCSLYFSTDPADGVPADFTVEVLKDGVVLYTRTYSGNRETELAVDGFTVYAPTALRLTVTRWSLPYRRVRILEMLTGLYERWGNRMLAQFEVTQQGEFSCLSLPYGSVRLVMDNKSRRFEPRRKDSIFQSIEERQSVEVYIGVRLPDGNTERVMLGKYYMAEDGWKTSDNSLTMEWRLVDIIGLVCNRTFVVPAVLPTTLGGWLEAIVSQLGDAFANRWHADPDYVNKPVLANNREAVTGKKCGDILRWACQATGTWPRARAEDGRLTAEPLWNQGNKLTLDNLVSYPRMTANQSIAALIFELALPDLPEGEEDTREHTYVVSGNATSSETTVTIKNPFIHSREQAIAAARLMLAQYGGNVIETTGRGDPSSEIGDVDTVWMDESNAATGRRMSQSFQIQNGVLQSCPSKLLQADGSYLFSKSVLITQSGPWTGPAGVSLLRVVIGQGGHGGAHGKPGTQGDTINPETRRPYEAKYGEKGADGSGGKVWFGTININPGETIQVRIGAGGGQGQEGGETTFGTYSSAAGQLYPNGYTDISNGKTYARTGVPVPLAGSGDGGKGGDGGEPGTGWWYHISADKWGQPEIWRYNFEAPPGPGYPGTPGGSGFVLVSWDKPEEVS